MPSTYSESRIEREIERESERESESESESERERERYSVVLYFVAGWLACYPSPGERVPAPSYSLSA